MTPLRSKLRTIIEVLNANPNSCFTTRELACYIDPELKKIHSEDRFIRNHDRRRLESMACSIGTMLNVLVEVGVVKNRIITNGKTYKIKYYVNKTVELV